MMTLKNLLFWFMSTLIIGGVAGLAIGFLFQSLLGSFYWLDLLLAGLTFSSVAMLGFFAYLVFQWLAQGLVRTIKMYHVLLIVLLLIVLSNLIYLNVSKFSGENLWLHLLIPIVLIATASIVAWVKVRLTNKKAFIPTLFFMVVATALEAIPSINPKEAELPLVTIFFTVIILLICNTWQILQLHRWVGGKSKASE